MATITLASLWISSALVTGCAGWIWGRMAVDLTRREPEGANEAAPQTSQEGAPNHSARELTKAHPKQRASIFDQMPPVETVRAQARAILASEDVWNEVDASEQLACLAQDVGNRRAAVARAVARDPTALRPMAQPASSTTLV